VRELILTFHGLGDPPGEVADAERKVWVPVHWLGAIVDAMPSRGVELAFDDGNRSDLEHALPVLGRAGVTARFFVLVGRIGMPGYLSEDGIGRLHAAGMRIGSHGLHHRDWRTLAAPELEDEVEQSRRRLSSLVGAAVDEAACPFGSYDRKVLRALRTAGYSRVFTSDGGSTSHRAWLASRTSVHRELKLEHWCELARGSGSRLPNPLLAGKQLLKRLR
jgi:peptidoglycan/xylan/chitin deacetylase (PgdA/CDA1 family)